ncbi:hypothetical protein BGW38_004491, partial [Lunasporangiospora selenospora]
SLARPLMKMIVKQILPTSKTYHSQAPQYGLFADCNIGAGRFIMEFKGEVSLKSAYKDDPINQYSILATPKPFVLFHPHLDLVVDARRSGNDARFARRSCFPNTELRSIVVPGVQDQTVHLGLFAKVPIAKGKEITLDWDWKKDHLALQPLKGVGEKSKDKEGQSKKNTKEIRKAKFLVASTLLAQTDCACESRDRCVLHQMLKDGTPEPASRDNETSSAKGTRPKKATLESLRQRYGNRRDQSALDDPDIKHPVDQDTTDDENSAQESVLSSRPSKPFRPENSSKKARHNNSYSRPRSTSVDRDSDSDSDDNRKRKSTASERQGSPLRRSSVAPTSAQTSITSGQEMSAREMKQALMLIKKMEDRDAAAAANGTSSRLPKIQSSSTVDGDPGCSSKRMAIGVTSQGRAQEKTRSGDFESRRSGIPDRKTDTGDDDSVSIGDSGIDSDSNNTQLRPDQASRLSSNKRSQPRPPQGKGGRGSVDFDIHSQSSATSDSEMRDTTIRTSKRRSPSQSGKKQPYTTASRYKRISELSAPKTVPNDGSSPHRSLDSHGDRQTLSGSSSVEGSFVSIVGNTSDEDDTDTGPIRQRQQNLPQPTMPPKPTVMPCKKVWKMIYLKQRALAEQEAREKAEEMRKKAEEVFDLKMEEVDSITIANEPTSFPEESPTQSAEELGVTEMSAVKTESRQPSTPPPTSRKDIDEGSRKIQPSVADSDILNLFGDHAKPDSSVEFDSTTKQIDIQDSNAGEAPFSAANECIVNVVQANDSAEAVDVIAKDVSLLEREKSPLRISLESYQSRRALSGAVVKEAEPHRFADSAAAPEAQPLDGVDVEMTEAEPERIEEVKGSQEPLDTVMKSPPVEESESKTPTPALEQMPAVLKVKLSLQEYQKKRMEASLRNNSNAPSSDTGLVLNVPSTLTEVAEPPAPDQENSTATEVEQSQHHDEDSNSTDVEMMPAMQVDEHPSKKEVSVESEVGQLGSGAQDSSSNATTASAAAALPAAEAPSTGDHFEVGGGLPTPLIGLSTGTGTQGTSGDYFPVQPFSPLPLSSGSTPFSKLNLASSPPRNLGPGTSGNNSMEPKGPSGGVGTKPPKNQKSATSALTPAAAPSNDTGPKDVQASGSTHTAANLRSPGSKPGSSPPQSQYTPTGWRTPRNQQRGPSPPHGPAHNQGESYRGYGPISDRSQGGGPLLSPTRERQHSSTFGNLPSSPLEPSGGIGGGGSYFGYGDDHKRSPTGPMSIPVGPGLGPREYHKSSSSLSLSLSEERNRYRSMNGDEWGYGRGGGGMESPGPYGGAYRGNEIASEIRTESGKKIEIETETETLIENAESAMTEGVNISRRGADWEAGLD